MEKIKIPDSAAAENLKGARQPEKEERLKIPEYNLGEGIEETARRLREKIAQQAEPAVAEIAGGSASGKTSAVASKIKETFGENAMIFSMDDYYRGLTFMKAEAAKGNVLNWDQPEAVNMELFREQLGKLKNGEAVQKPIYSMKTGESAGTEEVRPAKIIIVEGLFALNELIKDQGDVKVFVEIGTHGRILRRLLRDIERTGQKPADIIKYFAEVVEPMHEKYVESTKKNADLVINNEYDPAVEAEKSGLHEVQLKFRGKIGEKKLRQVGADRLAQTSQVDSYYNPKDRNLVETGEILRIREEGGRIILTYKGPKMESPYRKRPKFEFQIDEDTKNEFLAIYGDKIKVIRKDRTLYHLDGAVFLMDSVSKEENGQSVDLGDFVEIRSTDKKGDKNKIARLIAKLDLKPEDGIKESYFEM